MWSALTKNGCIPSLNDTNLPFEYDEQRSTPTQQDFSISSHHPCFLNEARKREIESDVQFVRSLPTISISTISIPKYSQSGRVAGIIVINITNKPVSSSTSASSSASPHQKNSQARETSSSCMQISFSKHEFVFVDEI